MPTKQVKKTETFWPPKFLVVLATVFLTIWIIIGVFFLLVIYSQIKQGFLRSLVAATPSQQVTPEQSVSQEADLPGVGKVNIDCVRSALSEESIGKIIETGNASNLSAEDKEKLDKCVVAKLQESPQPSPTG